MLRHLPRQLIPTDLYTLNPNFEPYPLPLTPFFFAFIGIPLTPYALISKPQTLHPTTNTLIAKC